MRTALDIAKYIVTKCVKEKHPITNWQLQKFLFEVYNEYRKRGQTAFYDEIEVSRYGPKIPSVYYHFCGFGIMPITDSYPDVQFSDDDREIIDLVVREKWEHICFTSFEEALF